MFACVTLGLLLPGVQVGSGSTPFIWHFAFGLDEISGERVICVVIEVTGIGVGEGLGGFVDLTTLYPKSRKTSAAKLIPIITVLFPVFFLFVFMSIRARKNPIYISSYT